MFCVFNTVPFSYSTPSGTCLRFSVMLSPLTIEKTLWVQIVESCYVSSDLKVTGAGHSDGILVVILILYVQPGYFKQGRMFILFIFCLFLLFPWGNLSVKHCFSEVPSNYIHIKYLKLYWLFQTQILNFMRYDVFALTTTI